MVSHFYLLEIDKWQEISEITNRFPNEKVLKIQSNIDSNSSMVQYLFSKDFPVFIEMSNDEAVSLQVKELNRKWKPLLEIHRTKYIKFHYHNFLSSFDEWCYNHQSSYVYFTIALFFIYLCLIFMIKFRILTKIFKFSISN